MTLRLRIIVIASPLGSYVNNSMVLRNSRIALCVYTLVVISPCLCPSNERKELGGATVSSRLAK